MPLSLFLHSLPLPPPPPPSLSCDAAGRELFQRHLSSEHSTENWQFCEDVDKFKTLPDSKLAKEARSIAAQYIGDGTPMAVSSASHLLTYPFPLYLTLPSNQISFC